MTSNTSTLNTIAESRFTALSLLILCLAVLLVSACASSNEKSKDEQNRQAQNPQTAKGQEATENRKAGAPDQVDSPSVSNDDAGPLTGGITPPPPPETCGIRGRIVKIDTARNLNTNERDPCYYAPCHAMVYLEDVGSCGRGLQVYLEPGDTVKINFTFSLSPTAMMPIAIGTPLPGLNIGDRFVATVSSRMMPYDQPPAFDVDVYRRVGH